VRQRENLSVHFSHRDGAIAAVREASLSVLPAECVGIVGESGSGKTQTFMAVMGLLSAGACAAGSVRFEGREILGASPSELNRVRGSKLTMIFQDPMTSLTPHLKVGIQLAEVLVNHSHMSWREAEKAALRALERVRVPEAQRRLRQYPHELSGGMRQRVMIGMSLLCEPKLLIADEPTTALDVTVQAQIMEILRAMRAESRMAIVLISHDLGLVAGLADRIIVMYAGRVVESAGAADNTGTCGAPLYRRIVEMRARPPQAAARANAQSGGPGAQRRRPRDRLRVCTAMPARGRTMPVGAARASSHWRDGASSGLSLPAAGVSDL
jgi:ABC-type dipeptide/oligopeptide/nickel transport system ATPase component